MTPLEKTLALIALSLCAAGCRGVSAEHALHNAIGEGFGRLANSFRSLGGVVETSVQDARHIADSIAGLPDATARDLDQFRHAGALLVETRADALAQFFPRTMSTFEGAFDREVQRLASLPSAPARLGIDPEARITGLRKSIDHFPTILRFDRSPFPVDASDADRTVEIAPSGRPPSYLERVTDRIRF